MKRLYLPLFLLLTMLFGPLVQAQIKEETRPAIRFGINGGGAWQCADIRSIGGGGLGATLEVPIVENDHSWLGVGIRGRYLWTATYGKDWKSTPDNSTLGYTFLNHRTSATNWDLELLLKANRLRAKTGVLLYVWGGVGAMGSKAKQNLSDEFFGGTPYNYAGIDQNQTPGQIISDLNFLRDWTYESPVHLQRWPNWRFAPSVGIGFGYEFTPWFSMAAEWKVTFPQTDILDGYAAPNDNAFGYNKDIHNYAGLQLEFGMFGGHSHQTNQPTDPNTYTPKGDGPAIVMVNPNSSNYVSNSGCSFMVTARLYNVRNKALITFTQNGSTVDPAMYSYNETNGDFSAMVNLGPGINQFSIVARNRYGTANQNFSASCQQPIYIEPIRTDPVPSGQPPQIFVTYPTACPAIVPDCRSVIKATVYNINSKQDLTIYNDGLQVPIQYYEYYPGNNEVVMNVELTPGDHRFEFIARNPYGQATATAMLRCPQQQPNLPTVVITNPGITPYNSPNCVQTIVATVTGVQSKNDISIHLDRAILNPNNWSYNPNNRQVTLTVSLQQGIQSMVEIMATNRYGRASDIQMLSCYQQLPPPRVVIVRPTGGVYNGPDCNQIVTAQIYNINSVQDVRVLLGNNVVPQQNYSYNPSNQLFVMEVSLTPSIREQITIIGTNTVGSDQATVSLGCTQPVEQQITICHIPPANPASVQTLTIPTSQWPGHQAHGDIQGPCSQTMVTICFQGQQMSVSQSAWPAFQNMGATQGPCQEPTIQICHIPPGNPAAATTISVPQSAWPSHQSHGDVQGTCNPQMVTICYNGENISVSQTVWKVYQNLGATLGPCPTRTITICHIPPGNPAAVQTLTIPETAWASHQAHGDVQGPCSNEMVEICYQGQTMSVSQSAFAVFQSLGATKGPCPPRQITICHIPPGNPAAAVTMTINENIWASHQAHGDVQGACATQQATLCYQGQTVNVSTTAVPALLSLGATQGACPPAEITICHIPPGNPSAPQTLTIPQTAWASHQAHGDVQGPCSKRIIPICYQNQTVLISETVWPYYQNLGATQGACPERTIQICHIPPGNPSAVQTITIPEAAWLSHSAHGDVQGPCNMTPMTICYREGLGRTGRTMEIPSSAWPAYQALGATQGPCPVPSITICHIPPGNPDHPETIVIPSTEWATHQAHGDTQGECDMSTVTICHKGSSRGQTATMNIPRASLPYHLSHGDTEGACPEVEITICHIPPGDVDHPQTLTIPQTAWAAHQAHGDTQGACNMTMMSICADGQTRQIPTASWPYYQNNGWTQGPCPVQDITICHIPPGNPANPQTITIPQTAWAAHQAHGDTQGACNMTLMRICLNGQEMNVPTASWAIYQGQGATQGPCPVQDITICHIPPGNPANPQTITIPPTAWAAHQAHGDTQGACNMTLMRICLNGQEMNVPTASWAIYQGQGATQGPCPVQDITICHIPPGNPANPQTITIPPTAWAAHQAHGDTQGACNMTPMRICLNGQELNVPTASWVIYQGQGATQGPCPVQNITICHIPPGDVDHPQTLTIPQTAWASHQAHGDTQGACNMTIMSICADGQTRQIPTASWPYYQSNGWIQGPCPSQDITICHIPPGNPGNPQTITIPQNAWAAHQAHGDVMGACNMTQMVICVDGQTLNVPTSSWAAYQSQGATQGPCPVARIRICHFPPGDPGNPQTIEVTEGEWPSHQAHGDVQGQCNLQQITICYQNQTIQIPIASWPIYQNLGATQGACVEGGAGKPKEGSNTGGGNINGGNTGGGNTVKPGTSTGGKPGIVTPGKGTGKTVPTKITICHTPPENPKAPVTLVINQTEWAAHEKHGDKQGPCATTTGKVVPK